MHNLLICYFHIIHFLQNVPLKNIIIFNVMLIFNILYSRYYIVLLLIFFNLFFSWVNRLRLHCYYRIILFPFFGVCININNIFDFITTTMMVFYLCTRPCDTHWSLNFSDITLRFSFFGLFTNSTTASSRAGSTFGMT